MKKIILTYFVLLFISGLESYAQNTGNYIFNKGVDYGFSLADSIFPQNVLKMLIVDINADYYKDLIFLTSQAGDVKSQGFNFLITFLNNTNGSFNQDKLYKCDKFTEDIEYGLINNDNFNDLVLYGDSLCILINDGNGNFEFDYILYDLGGSVVEVCKLNSDDLDDLVIRTNHGHSFMTLLNNDAGVFNNVKSYSIDSIFSDLEFQDILAITEIACPDLNNDNFDDISMTIYWKTTAGRDSGTIINYLNDGNANFNFKTEYKGIVCPREPFIWSDIDGDNNIDVISKGGNGFIVANGNGEGLLSKHFYYNFNFEKITASDFDGDGYPDIALTTLDSVLIILNKIITNNDFILNESYNIFIPQINGSIAQVTSGDIDNDSDVDLIISNYNSFHGGFTIFENTTKTVDIKEKAETYLINAYELFQNYPNPFNPSTIIKYSLPEASSVELRIYDVLGSEVKSFIINSQMAGNHEIRWDGNNNFGVLLSSGVYIYKIKLKTLYGNKQYEKSAKMVLTK